MELQGWLMGSQEPTMCPYPSYHLHLSLPSSLFPSSFKTKILYAFLTSPIQATYPAHLIFIYFITLIISGETYKL
jgi:hypothetical protein